MFSLDEVVPWGRSFAEYQRMFALGHAELRLNLVACADGPASFNAEATRRGGRVTSCDPMYRLDAARIRERIAATCDTILEQTRRNADDFVWDAIRSVEALRATRMAAMTDFLDDYVEGKAHGRYIDAALPELPFPDGSFDLSLCSHFLFLYTTQLGEEFHLAAIQEMCRVAAEVRVFPLLALDGRRSPYVDRTIDAVRSAGCNASIEPVPYEFQRGGNQMLRIARSPKPAGPGS
jgi:hypothetical protein